MPSKPPPATWKRLGQLLEQRRVELDPRYRNLALFAEDRDLNYRLAWDIETGRRTNYRRPTLRAIEVAYGLEPGSVDTALAGGELKAAPGARETRRDDPAEALQFKIDDLQRQLDELREQGQLRIGGAKRNGGEYRKRA
jgi:hypothetical protein